MKRSLFVVLVVLAVAVLLPQALQAGIGIKGGLSLAKFEIKSTEPLPFSFSNLKFATGGIYFGINLGIISIQPEVLYTRMGARYAVDADSLEYRLDYVQVPVLLKVNVIPVGPIRPFIYAGGYGAYLIKADGVMTVGGTTAKEDITDEYLRTDYGAVAGAGVCFKLPGVALTAEGRYNLGLQNIAKNPAPGDSLKNRSVMVLVGIGF